MANQAPRRKAAKSSITHVSTNATKSRRARELGLKKLELSGLTEEDAKLLHMTFLGPEEVARLHPSFKPLCSLRINYLGLGGTALSDWPASKPFYRLRYLEQPTDFAAVSEKKPVRYVQEPTTAPVAYYPANQDDWPAVAENPDRPIILTEGELKAAKACKEGFPTIGLGGVYNWRSYKLGLPWLPSLDVVKWAKRNVYVCFDSDYRTNPMVCAALRELAEMLHLKGSFVHLTSLPNLPDMEKVGLDDFLVNAGPSANDMFRELLQQSEPLGLTSVLWNLNDKYVYVRDPGLVVDQKSRFKVTASAFKDHLEATSAYYERSLKADGSVSYKQVPAASHWIRWPLRTEVTKMTYQPGRPRFVSTDVLLFNTWPGWGVEPSAGDPGMFIRLVDHLFTGAEPGAKEWFLRWCAYPLQHPGVKMFSSALLHGIKHGTGKSLVGYTLGRIYGQNFTEISSTDLHGSFNDWAEAKQFVMGDDITGSNKRSDNDLIKKMITQRELRVNTKYVPAYVVPDCINYYFTANHPDTLFLEDDDRRHFIHEVTVGALDEEFYVEYDLWLDTGGAAAVFDYLLKLDLGDFNPAAPAFKTAAKERMIVGGQSDLAGWVRGVKENPDQWLVVGQAPIKRDLFTSRELLTLYDPEGRTGTTANGLGRELARAGIRHVADGKPLRLPDGTQARYYAVRNPERWALARPAECTQHLTEQAPSAKQKKF